MVEDEDNHAQADQPERMPDDRTRTVLVALGAGVGVALAKVVAVFVEDAVSVGGDVIALAAVALNQITESSIVITHSGEAMGPGFFPGGGAVPAFARLREARKRCWAPCLVSP